MPNENNLLQAALSYAKRGWPVIALHTPEKGGCSCGKQDCDSIGKHPRYNKKDLPHGVHSATIDEKTIKTWWERWPTANVGIATGKRSFDALDVDTGDEDGNDTLNDFEAKYGKLPNTVEQITGGGGRQIFFKAIGNLPNAVRFAPGLDIRTDGGLVVAPPSLHTSGQRYEWELCSLPGETLLAPWPPWLIDKVKGGSGVGNKSTKAPGWQGEALKGVPKDYRNATCTKLAGRYISLGLSDDEIKVILLDWNQRNKPPLPDADILKTIKSVRATHQRNHPDDTNNNMNKKHGFVMVQGKARVMTFTKDRQTGWPTFTLSSVHDFRNLYLNELVPDPEKPGKTTTVANLWLKSPQRRQYHGIVFAPYRKTEGFYNMFQKLPVNPVRLHPQSGWHHEAPQRGALTLGKPQRGYYDLFKI